jgi:hypothetical protein
VILAVLMWVRTLDAFNARNGCVVRISKIGTCAKTLRLSQRPHDAVAARTRTGLGWH